MHLPLTIVCPSFHTPQQQEVPPSVLVGDSTMGSADPSPVQMVITVRFQRILPYLGYHT